MTQWNQLSFPQGGGGGQQVYPGSGTGGGSVVYTPPASTISMAMAHAIDSHMPALILGMGTTTHHGRHVGHHATRKHTHKAKIWHAPAHPSRKKDLPEGIEDQPF